MKVFGGGVESPLKVGGCAVKQGSQTGPFFYMVQ